MTPTQDEIRQMVEALRGASSRPARNELSIGEFCNLCDDAADLLSRLAQQEPVGWLVDPCPLGPLRGGSRERRLFTDLTKAQYEAWHKDDRVVPLFAAPVPAPKE